MNTPTDSQTPDENHWETLPGRIYPIRYFREFTVAVILLAFLSISWIVLGIVAWICLKVNPNKYVLYGIFILGFTSLGFHTFRVVKSLVKTIWARNRFQHDQAQAVAQILRRRATRYWDDGTKHNYDLQLEFRPIAAAINADNNQRFEVSIDRSLYESLLEKNSVTVIYALENPRIFLLEGE